jgi:hypothetical protein
MLVLSFLLFFFTLIDYTYSGYPLYTIRRVPSSCPHGFRSAEGLLWGADQRFELGPALQQADALLYESRCTLRLISGGRFM